MSLPETETPSLASTENLTHSHSEQHLLRCTHYLVVQFTISVRWARCNVFGANGDMAGAMAYIYIGD